MDEETMKRPKIEDYKQIIRYIQALEKYADFIEEQAAHWHDAYAKAEQQIAELKEENEELINEARTPDTVKMPLKVYADKLRTIDIQADKIAELKERVAKAKLKKK